MGDAGCLPFVTIFANPKRESGIKYRRIRDGLDGRALGLQPNRRYLNCLRPCFSLTSMLGLALQFGFRCRRFLSKTALLIREQGSCRCDHVSLLSGAILLLRPVCGGFIVAG